jgi:hypothetical protein
MSVGMGEEELKDWLRELWIVPITAVRSSTDDLDVILDLFGKINGRDRPFRLSSDDQL